MKLAEVVQGRIKVHDVIHYIDHPNFHVWEIDLGSKYPGEVDWLSTDEGVSFMILPDSRTINTVDTDVNTQISFTGINGWDWTVMSEAARYTWRIVLYRDNLLATDK